MKFAVRITIILAILVILVWQTVEDNGQTQAQVASTNTVVSYEDELRRITEKAESLAARAQKMSNSWAASEWTAEAYLEQARLTGSYESYLQAQHWLDNAFEISGGVGGPYLARARLNYSLHRLTAAQDDSDYVAQGAIVLADTKRALTTLNADIAFQQGRYQEAFEGYSLALESERSFNNLFKMAYYHSKTGDVLLAESLTGEALSLVSRAPSLQAFLHLHKGIFDLERGKYRQALAHYEDAETAFPNWWLIAEHKAEIYALQGKNTEAKTMYQDIIAETGHPEFMDALASLYLSENNVTGAQIWIKRAREIYQERLDILPEAVIGHSLEHFLAFGEDDEMLVKLAEQNYELRSNGEAQTLLLQAYLKADKLKEAKELALQAAKSSWVTAEFYGTLALTWHVLDDNEESRVYQQRATNIHPKIMDQLVLVNMTP